MSNDLDSGSLRAILKEITEVFAKYDIDYLSGIGISMTVARAGMLGMGMTPDEAESLLKAVAEIYRTTHTSPKDILGELDCNHDCDNCSSHHEDTGKDDNLWYKIDVNLN